MTVTCDEEAATCEGQASFVADAAQVECALTALRDRTVGVITWDETASAGYAERNGYVVVLPDGSVITRHASREDEGGEAGPALLGAALAASFFEDCLGEADIMRRFECLTFDAAAPTTVCVE